MRSTTTRCLAVLALLLPACAGAPGDAPSQSSSSPLIVRRWPPLVTTWSTTDPTTAGSQLPSGTATSNGASVAWEVGHYQSDGLLIYALLCYPTSAGEHPIAILNHGLSPYDSSTSGFPAIESIGVDGCITMAGYGWITATSTYRGEQVLLTDPPYSAASPFTRTSQGVLELCNGEVDDAMNLLSEVAARSDANSSQVLMWGHSHGSCITERAIENGAGVQIAVSLDGPTDFTTWPGAVYLAPTTAEQVARSPVDHDPAALAGVKYLRIHAEGDEVVSVTQACELANDIPGITSYHLYSGVEPPGVYYTGPSACASYPLTWQPGKYLLPDEVAGGVWSSPTLLVYSGLTHGTIRGTAWEEEASFVNQFAQSAGWSARMPPTFTPLSNSI